VTSSWSFILQLCAYVILMCCKTQSRTPWSWCRQTPRRDKVKKWL